MAYWLQIAIGFATLIAAGTHIAGKQVISLLYSQRWASESCVELLRVYALYIICCAFNGISEAYAFAKSDSDRIAKLRNLMMLNSTIYLGACYLFAVEPGFFGFKGLVYANCLNMAMRAISSLYFAHQHNYEFMTPAANR